MTRILGISGSLRRGSFNSGLLRAASELMPAGAELVTGSIRGIPLYDADDEAENGVPPAVRVLKDQLAAADGLLIVTPEYNNAMPGVAKNAIDWLTRPTSDIAPLFHGRPVAVIGASNGAFGTILAQNAWQPVLRTLRTRPWHEGRLLVTNSRERFDAEGNLTDETIRNRLAEFLAGFAAFAALRRET
jgi:NAD(P)H-dependent FMN reductase